MATTSITKTALDALAAKRSALSSGYDPIPQNRQLYQHLANCIAGGTDERRQSPLVNAGYAMRLSVVVNTALSFLTYNANEPVQLVVLGCGLDVLGLWVHWIHSSFVTVFELDIGQITRAKKKLLLESNLVLDLRSEGDDALIGSLLHPNDRGQSSPSSAANYYLFPCDLRDIESVKPCFRDFDKSKPTLVLSELVLTYLGRNAMDRILSWCAEHLCGAQTSCMAAFETLSPTFPLRHSVLEGYKEKYCQHFVDKLSRGLAKFDPNELFYPPGCNVASVETRFRGAGFSTSVATLAGNAMMNQTLDTPEPFDEHAALALYARSYVLVLGFARGVELRMVRTLCPWSSVVKHDFPATVHGPRTEQYTIRVIEAKDQEKVRNLYSHSYEHLFKDYPSVRKMVKSGLKTDLCYSMDDIERAYSTVGTRFGLAGGVFLVAMDESNGILWGCVGLRRHPRLERQHCGNYGGTFEIQKLAVDRNSRGKGVGTALIRALETFLTVERNESQSCCTLIATTPAILLAANNLYASSGFELSKEETIGKMTMNSYCKVI